VVVKVTLTQLLMVQLAMGKHEEDKLSSNNSPKEEEDNQDQDQEVTAILVKQTQDQI